MFYPQGRPEKPLPALSARPPPPTAIVPRAADGPRPPGWNGQPRRHGSSRFNVQHHNQELVKLPPIKGESLLPHTVINWLLKENLTFHVLNLP
ncbi:hypothetical protein RR48_05688 [Papilio machaon]|uniref:Uncharacterized protein n=1 Tax=Papilio machaon TaxID=76193 RepID=A0A0N1PFI9_PAPMA|nr:hypothetical protein RR48_05688 [Papilio machaon]